MEEKQHQSEIIMYQTEDGSTRVNVTLENDTVWLTQAQMAELFQTTPQNITTHISNVYKEGELSPDSTCKDILQVQMEGARNIERLRKFYNLDVIISVGYRVKSLRGTQFRIWANKVLREYLIKGFAMDDERLKGTGGGDYWKELLDRIRDIRSSEKVLYRQVLDLYAQSVDYDPKSDESVRFFKIVQNKLHYAAHGHTAAEVIYERADAEKPFMGLTSFSGDLPSVKDIGIAKNYLSSDELKILNNLVSGYFDFAELQALRHKPMYMCDYVRQLDNILSSTGEKVLEGAGSVSHEQALDKAKSEYRKYHAQTLSPVEKDYLSTIKSLQKQIEKTNKNGR